MEKWDSTPRIAFLSPEPGSGKSRALEVTQLLVPRPVDSMNFSPAYMFRKIGAEEGRPTILYDEIDTVFGPKAKNNNEEIRGLLNAGHRRNAVAGRCVVIGKQIVTEEFPAYCAVALAGLGHLPDTILSRSVIVRMRPRVSGEFVESFRSRVQKSEGDALREKIELWAKSVENGLGLPWPNMPATVTDRNADIWEPLIAIADAAGGDWPVLARNAAVALVADSKGSTASLGIRLLTDLREIFANEAQMSTEAILIALCALPEAPWGAISGKPIDARGLANRLGEYGIKSKTIRTDATHTPKGYYRADMVDAFDRYLGDPPQLSATSATSQINALIQEKTEKFGTVMKEFSDDDRSKADSEETV
jgi:hypothetical protein